MNERPRFLAELAKEDRNLQTPRRVEAALRERVAAAARRPSLWERFRWPAAVAGLASAFALVVLMLPRTPQTPLQPPVIATVSTPTPPPVQEPVHLVSTAAPEKPAIAKRPPLPRVSTPVQERITRRFYELAYAPPELLANSRIMRVRVPRAALLSFGLPLSAYQAQDEKVAADVIYTEDGIARAIRFVETNNQE